MLTLLWCLCKIIFIRSGTINSKYNNQASFISVVRISLIISRYFSGGLIDSTMSRKIWKKKHQDHFVINHNKNKKYQIMAFNYYFFYWEPLSFTLVLVTLLVRSTQNVYYINLCSKSERNEGDFEGDIWWFYSRKTFHNQEKWCKK